MPASRIDSALFSATDAVFEKGAVRPVRVNHKSWKNSGKAAWKKRIHKIKENARARKSKGGALDEKDLREIAALQDLIREREDWECRETLRLKLENSISNSAVS